MSLPVASRETELLQALGQRIDQSDPHAFNNLGVLYHRKGMHAEAIDALLRAVTLAPRMGTALRNLETAASSEGALDRQLAAFAARVAAQPDDRDAVRDEARLLRLVGRYTEATQKLDALIAEDPDDAAALLERGLLELRSGDLQRAQRWLERAAHADPRNPAARLSLAETLYQRGQYAAALDTLDALVLLEPTLGDAHLLRGFVLGDMGRPEDAADATRRAAALNPAGAAARQNLSLELAPRGAQRDAQGVPPAVTTLGARSGTAHYGLGRAFRQRGYFAEARHEFQRALTQGEDDRLVLYAIAELELVGGNATAAALYEQLMERHGEHARWRSEHGVALHQSGRLDEAAASYRRALRSDPRYALAYNNLGVLLAARGDGAAAGDAFTQALAVDPTLLRARLNLARWHRARGELPRALTLLGDAAAFHPGNGAVWHCMALVLEALHRPEDAAEATRTAASCLPECRTADAGRLTLGIELQEECPEAANALDLLAVAERQPADAGSACVAPGNPLLEADAYATSGSHLRALEHYQRVRRTTDADRAHALWRRAAIGEVRALCLLGRGSEALGLVHALALATTPADTDDDAELMALVASAHAESWRSGTGDARAARRAIAQFVRLDSRSAALLYLVGNAAVAINEDGLATVLFRRALAADPTRPSPRVAIARVLRRANDVLAARLELVAALSAAPILREALLELARLHCDAGSAAEALPLLVAHLAREPRDVEALALLATALLDCGREAEARQALDRARQQDPDHPETLWLHSALSAREALQNDATALSTSGTAPGGQGR